ncbi:MAG: GNAT family N-acetyltransferase [Methanomassiliicoccales archaeon]|nr:GNAT family N-acetyltransferase [Methanomassiliicoccales archaeon]NYT15664.1 GNAT family N-acetyltransferase [Methanomassiliicoccales archaeon]
MTEKEITIRKFRIDDYERVIRLWQESELEHRPTGRDTRERIAAEIEKETAIFLVAEMDSEMVGSIFCTHDGRKGWLNRISVLPEKQRKGIASALIREGERRLRELGIEVICALIWRSNLASRELFENQGYDFLEDALYYVKKDRPDI